MDACSLQDYAERKCRAGLQNSRSDPEYNDEWVVQRI
jgi:hypothetical protein